jgi:hypothetical protein
MLYFNLKKTNVYAGCAVGAVLIPHFLGGGFLARARACGFDKLAQLATPGHKKTAGQARGFNSP